MADVIISGGRLMADVIISGFGDPLPRPVSLPVYSKLLKAKRLMEYAGLSVLIIEIEIEENHDKINEYSQLQRDRVLESISEAGKKDGYYDFDPEITFEVQNKITNKQYLMVQECSNLVPLSSRTGYKI